MKVVKKPKFIDAIESQMAQPMVPPKDEPKNEPKDSKK